MRQLTRLRLIGLGLVTLFALSERSVAAELIKVPQGLVIRSLFDWEQTNGLEFALGDMVLPGTRTPDGADVSVPDAALCFSAAYRGLNQNGALPFIDLSHLCTGPAEESTTFALIADTQELHDEHQKTAALLADLATEYPEVKFVVTAGDIVDKGSKEEWQKYRAIASTHYTHRLPIVPVLGNHEYFDDPSLSHFNRVYRTERTAKGYYALDLGPAVLIVLNSNVDRMSAEERDAQTSWLTETLRHYAGQKPMLATYHHPAYSTGVANIFMPGPPRYAKERWLPLFAQFGVKLVLNGHEHVYERLLIEGVHYVNAGPAGGSLGRTKPFRTRYTQAVLKNVRTVSIIKVTRSGDVTLRTYSPDQDGGLVDEASF